jgi:chromatin remodeling complex protein RSC6
LETVAISGALIKNDTFLIIGGSKKISKFSLENPLSPILLKTIDVPSTPTTFIQISEEKLLCG